MLAKSTLQNLSTALKAYEQFSADLSKQVQVEDESINKLFKKVFEENSINIKNSKKEEEIDSYISMLFIAKEFERIGDLSKNIGKEDDEGNKQENKTEAKKWIPQEVSDAEEGDQ